MKHEALETWVNFRIDNNLQEQLDTRALHKGVSRAELARQFFKQGLKLPDDTPQAFALLLFEKTSGMNKASKVRDIAIDTLTELFK